MKKPYKLFLTFLTIAVFGCSLNKKIETIISKADCEGPNGKYTTEVHSSIDGYTFFEQKYSYKDNFTAVAYSDSTGYVISGDSASAMDGVSIFIIKSHEFHLMAEYPENYFTPVKKSANDTLNVTDKLGNPVQIFFDGQKRFTGYKFKNPSNPHEEIVVNYKNYKEINGHDFAERVEILQGIKDKYIFDFTTISVNSEKFKKIEL